MTIAISSNFCGGNIICKKADKASDIRLDVRKDNKSDFYQWFYFRLTGAKGQACRMIIENAGDAAYTGGWKDYQAVISYDLQDWQRVATIKYDGKALTISLTPEHDSVYVAYFAPYTLHRHAELVAGAQMSGAANVSVLGQTLDGLDLDLITIGEAGEGKKQLWFTARQHPGETMAEWWMEGFLNRLLDPSDPVAKWLLERAVFHVVPNMNPDGSKRGHLRTNAAGVNLNREWAEPSMDKSPEVFLTLQQMHKTGVDFALDVHGDEALPYNFIAGCEGVPDFTDELRTLVTSFKDEYVSANADFQTKYGYPENKPGSANLSICGNAISHLFDCASMTLEMPFKDNADRPDTAHGWSPTRSKRLGADVLDALAGVFDLI